MKCNVGTTEKIIRVILGIGALYLGYVYNPWWYLLAAILIITAAIGWCPLTAMLGINTCKKSEENSDEQKQEETQDNTQQQEASQTEESPATSEDGPSIESWKGPEQK